MSLYIKVKNFLGIDFQRDYLWLNAKEYSGELEETFKIKQTCRLTRKCKSKIILGEGVNLSIENEFEGIVIGKKSTIKVSNSFKGLLACQMLICSQGTKIDGDIYIEKLLVSEKVDFNVSVNQIEIEEMIYPEIEDLRNNSIKELKEKYFRK